MRAPRWGVGDVLLGVATLLAVVPALRGAGRRPVWWWVTAGGLGLSLLAPLAAPHAGAGCRAAGTLLANVAAAARVVCEILRGALCDGAEWALLLGLLGTGGGGGGGSASGVKPISAGTVRQRRGGWTAGRALGAVLETTCAAAALAAVHGHVIRAAEAGSAPSRLAAAADALSALRRLAQAALLRAAALRLHEGLRALNARCRAHRSTKDLPGPGASSKEGNLRFGRALRRRYGRLRNASEAFNALFGWRVLLLFMECFVRVEFNFGVYLKDPRESELVWLIDATVLPLGMTIVTISCDMAAKEADELLVRVRELEDELPWGARKQQLRHLALYMESHRVRFSASGFFRLDRNTVFSFTNVINTYLIVILQMC